MHYKAITHLLLPLLLGISSSNFASAQPISTNTTVTGSANGAAAAGDESADGGRGGVIIAEFGVNVDVGRGDLPALDHDMTLSSGDYHFRQVAPGAGGAPPVITIQGDVRIYCQYIFWAEVRADFAGSSSPPSVSIHAGHPTMGLSTAEYVPRAAADLSGNSWV